MNLETVERNGQTEKSTMNLSQIIKEVRNGRTMKQFATLLGVSEASISRYESGQRRPSAPVFSAMLSLATPEQQTMLLSAIKEEQ